MCETWAHVVSRAVSWRSLQDALRMTAAPSFILGRKAAMCTAKNYPTGIHLQRQPNCKQVHLSPSWTRRAVWRDSRWTRPARHPVACGCLPGHHPTAYEHLPGYRLMARGRRLGSLSRGTPGSQHRDQAWGGPHTGTGIAATALNRLPPLG